MSALFITPLYPPRDPQPLFPAVSGAHLAPIGPGVGRPKPWGVPKGTQRPFMDPAGTHQGPHEPTRARQRPSSAQKASQVSSKSAPKLESYKEPPKTTKNLSRKPSIRLPQGDPARATQGPSSPQNQHSTQPLERPGGMRRAIEYAYVSLLRNAPFQSTVSASTHSLA